MNLEHQLRDIPGTRSVYAERVATGYFLDIVIKRESIARYGLAVDDVNEVIQTAIGGMNLTTTVEGRARYPVNIRYPRELRNDVDKLKRILVPVMTSRESIRHLASADDAGFRQYSAGAAGRAGRFSIIRGPTAIKSEEGLLTSYVYIDITGRDVGGYVEEARKKAATIKLPEGYRLVWSGEYEYILKTHERLKLIIPFTLLIIFDSALLQYAFGDQDGHCSSGRAFFAGRFFLALVPAQLQHEHCRLGGDHRSGRSGCGNRRGHALVSGSGL